ncbi:hypothetical protein ACE4RR_05975 [Alteribacillus sp. HJP-4]
MKVYAAAAFLLLLFGCSPNDSGQNETLTDSEDTVFSNSLYSIAFEDIKENGDGFTIHFSITAEDESRTLNSEETTMIFPEEIEDDNGGSYILSEEAEVTRDKKHAHVLHASQFFEGKLEDKSEYLSVPTELELSGTKENVRFESISAEDLPVTRSEMTIQDISIDKNTLTITATDVLPIKNVEWSLEKNADQIFPMFTNTLSEEEHYLKTELEFMGDPGNTFTLIAKRQQSSPLRWELPFVVPAEEE